MTILFRLRVSDTKATTEESFVVFILQYLHAEGEASPFSYTLFVNPKAYALRPHISAQWKIQKSIGPCLDCVEASPLESKDSHSQLTFPVSAGVG